MSGRPIPVGELGRAVGQHIQALRRAHGLTQVGMSARLVEVGREIPPNSVGRIEIGTRRVDLDDVEAIARVFGVSPVQLIDGTAVRDVALAWAASLRSEADRIEREAGLS
jgi:transcriptional regulator with XRE-family HTH domain